VPEDERPEARKTIQWGEVRHLRARCENGGAKLDHRAAILSRVRAVRN